MSKKKVALITGSSKGIGAKAAMRLADEGFSIVLNYKASYQEADILKQEIVQKGSECIAVQADVSQEHDVAKLFNAVDKMGRLAVLVNNAGILEMQTRLEGISSERFKRILELNVMPCFLCTKEAIKRMSTKYGGTGGSIINISSVAAKTGAPNEYVDYAASKGAIDSFTRGSALEVEQEEIRVNAVRSALIKTSMHTLGVEVDRVERLKSAIPIGKGGLTEKVAETIVRLASDRPSYVTGSFVDC